MKLFVAAVLLVSLLASASSESSQAITITRSDSQSSRRGPPPSRTSGGRVTFEPGARTAWHTHPLGQTLIVTAGTGWVQEWGGPTEEIREGDVVWIPPGQKHWHGATPTGTMTHIAIQEFLDGKNVNWMETVSDEQYRR
ncbi:MAG: cupin [Gemmatimonadetes bacterium 13_1_40CM_4_65_7]|nr:MAG: cupin [Gemmatimonadetes bacterium 13_1_40CM_4_65_7]